MGINNSKYDVLSRAIVVVRRATRAPPRGGSIRTFWRKKQPAFFGIH